MTTRQPQVPLLLQQRVSTNGMHAFEQLLGSHAGIATQLLPLHIMSLGQVYGQVTVPVQPSGF